MLNKEERRVVGHIVGRRRGWFDTIFEYGVYVAPSLAFAIYGIWREDVIAIGLAYGALLGVVVLYLSYARRSSRLLQSALQKYEEAVKALSTHE